MTTAPRLDRADRDALDRFREADRRAGRSLSPAVVDAFERLTPRQLDALLAADGSAGDSSRDISEGGRADDPSGPHGLVRRWLRGPGRTAVALGVAFVAATATAVIGITLLDDSATPPAAESGQVTDARDLAQQLSWADAYGEAFADDF
ncbi:hypothetical protein ACFQ80_14580 [Isoptericola sp. NPDC056578]|uniref:hypothetical protein n=1 Tax=Isoptericola sp. NPDC056578 TaxID=3345870 RepID=UPI0036B3B6A5